MTIKYRGSELKRFIIEGQIDKKNKRKISVNTFINTTWKEHGGPNKTKGIYNYWAKHKSVVEAEPYPNEPITEKLIWRYAIDNGYFTEEEVPFEVFSKKNNKKTFFENNKEKVIKRICSKLQYPFSRTFSPTEIQETLEYIYGKDFIQQLYEEEKKIMEEEYEEALKKEGGENE